MSVDHVGPTSESVAAQDTPARWGHPRGGERAAGRSSRWNTRGSQPAARRRLGSTTSATRPSSGEPTSRASAIASTCANIVGPQLAKLLPSLPGRDSFWVGTRPRRPHAPLCLDETPLSRRTDLCRSDGRAARQANDPSGAGLSRSSPRHWDSTTARAGPDPGARDFLRSGDPGCKNCSAVTPRSDH
jgi:hypothetical protein